MNLAEAYKTVMETKGVNEFVGFKKKLPEQQY